MNDRARRPGWRALALAAALGLAGLAAAWARAGDTPPVRPDLAGPPRVVDPRPLGVGRLVADAGAPDLDGERRTLGKLLGPQATVVALTSTTCPVAMKLAPALARLEAEMAARGVAFVFVNVDAADTAERCREQVAAHGLRGRYLLDRAGEIAAALGATTTTEAFVLDAARTLQFRGAVSDRYGIDFAKAAAGREYLREALGAVLDARAPDVAATTAPGCALERPAAPSASPSAPTYHGRISRIVSGSCLPCHRPGGVAPFALETYEQVSAKAKMIAHVVEHRIMPPWLAAPPAPGAPSPWANDRSLPEEDRAALLAWVAAGKPEGDPRDAVAPRRFRDKWSMGRPDVVFELPEEVEVAAEGVMPYVLFRVPTGILDERWVQAVEVSPTARAVVHHVLVFAVPPAVRGDRRRPQLDERRGFLGIYGPGTEPIVYPDGYAKRLPAGWDLMFQIHYTPNGRPARDRTRIGLIFAKERPRHVVRLGGISNRRLLIPPGARRHEEKASVRAPADVRVLAYIPHMHTRGVAMRFEAERPGGAAEVLLDVPRWDFGWQLRYALREPLDLARGTQVTVRAWYDNSELNPSNPDPTRAVPFGEQTTDEMLLGYVEFVLAEENFAAPDGNDGSPFGGGRRRRGE